MNETETNKSLDYAPPLLESIHFDSNPCTALFFSLWIFWTAFFIFNVVLFFHLKSSFYIRCRSPWLIFSSAIGQYLMTTTLVLKLMVGPTNFYNFFDHWFIWFMLPLHFFPYLVRSLRFIIIYHIHHLEYIIDEAKSKNLTPNQNQSDNINEYIKDKGCFIKLIAKLYEHNKLVTDTTFLILLWIIIGIAFIVGLIRCIVVEQNHWGIRSQSNSELFWVTILVFWVIVQILLWIAVYFLRKIHDELKYNFELTSIGICWLVFIGLYIIIGWLEDTPTIVPSIIANILCIVSMLISFGMPIQLAYVKPPEVKLGGGFDKLANVLKNKETYKIFLDYAVKKNCPQNIYFYNAVKRFKKITDPKEISEEYLRIKDKFLNNDKPITKVNVHGEIIKELEKVKEITTDVFDVILMDSYKLMETDTFPRFKTSCREFKQYVKQQMAKRDLIIEN